MAFSEVFTVYMIYKKSIVGGHVGRHLDTQAGNCTICRIFNISPSDLFQKRGGTKSFSLAGLFEWALKHLKCFSDNQLNIYLSKVLSYFDTLMAKLYIYLMSRQF